MQGYMAANQGRGGSREGIDPGRGGRARSGDGRRSGGSRLPYRRPPLLVLPALPLLFPPAPPAASQSLSPQQSRTPLAQQGAAFPPLLLLGGAPFPERAQLSRSRRRRGSAAGTRRGRGRRSPGHAAPSPQPGDVEGRRSHGLLPPRRAVCRGRRRGDGRRVRIVVDRGTGSASSDAGPQSRQGRGVLGGGPAGRWRRRQRWWRRELRFGRDGGGFHGRGRRRLVRRGLRILVVAVVILAGE
mmetsp:Transcript_24139/g.58322  ORF Transcript_24139/g.58322 Transcript_24139/m.58322 type:complete len:242 (+) Transcript_24139:16-741(+)